MRAALLPQDLPEDLPEDLPQDLPRALPRRKPRLLRPARLLLLLLTLALVPAALAQAAPGPTGAPSAPASHAAPDEPARLSSSATVTVAAVGDIACRAGEETREDRCQQAATAALVAERSPDAVLVLGDLQYPNGSLIDFQRSYALSWGRFFDITYPAPGNHEYHSGAQGYFAYWGARAGDPSRGYYSFDLGAWHVLALNSNCQAVGGCDADSAQVRWIAQDLAANPARCTLAFFHHPRFSSGPHGNNDFMAPLWDALQAGGVDVVLSGHDHDYERFGLQDSSGKADAEQGMRQFVAGTGGASRYFMLLRQRNTEARSARSFGVLFLELEPDAYRWEFVPTTPDGFRDAGSERCR